MFKRILIFTGSFLSASSFVSAQCKDDMSTNGFGKICNPVAKDIDSIESLIEVILRGVVNIGMYVIVLAFIWVGFKFVSAQGESGKISEAKKSLWMVIGGAAVILGSNVILSVVTDTAQELIKPVV